MILISNTYTKVRLRAFAIVIFLCLLTLLLNAQNSDSCIYDSKFAEGHINTAQRVGVALSGGGALGFCHIGALEALDSGNIKIDVITGSSIGSLIAALYANGYSGEEILKILTDEHVDRLMHIYRPNFHFSGGLIDTRRLQRKLMKYLPHNSFDSLKIKFYCCVSDMNNCKVRYVSTGGNLVQFVIASMAIPAVFAPVKIDDIYYFDGGSYDMMPFQPLVEENCGIRICIFPILSKPHNIKSPRLLWLDAYNALFYSSILRNKDHFTHAIAIDPHKYNSFSFKHLTNLRTIGYCETLKQIPNIGTPVDNSK